MGDSKIILNVLMRKDEAIYVEIAEEALRSSKMNGQTKQQF